MKDAVGYLEQIKTDEPPQTYSKFLEIMTEFRSEK
jgi:histone deacetylase complex regulatory component SIN3